MQTFTRKEKREKRKGTTLRRALFLFSLFVVLCAPSFSFAGMYVGPTGIVFTDQQDTTGGGGVLNDVTFVSNANFTVCTNLNGAVMGAWATTNGNTYGIVDYGGAGSATGDYIKDGDWVVYQQTAGVGCDIGTSPSVKGTFTIASGVFSSTPVAPSSSRIYDLIPAQASTTASTNVFMGATVDLRNSDFENACRVYGYDFVLGTSTYANCPLRLKLHLENGEGGMSLNMSTSSLYTIDLGAVASSSATTNFSTTTVLATGVYNMVAVLYMNDQAWLSSNSAISDHVRFTVVSTQLSPAQQTDFYNSGGVFTLGSSTPLDSTNLISFLNVPQLLKTRVPFAYIYSFASVLIDDVSSSTLTSTLPSGGFTVVIGTSTYAREIVVDMFSTSTITHFLTPTMVSLFRGLMVAITFISFGFFLFHHARSREHL